LGIKKCNKPRETCAKGSTRNSVVALMVMSLSLLRRLFLCCVNPYSGIAKMPRKQKLRGMHEVVKAVTVRCG
jgi:hypothetical protein